MADRDDKPIADLGPATRGSSEARQEGLPVVWPLSGALAERVARAILEPGRALARGMLEKHRAHLEKALQATVQELERAIMAGERREVIEFLKEKKNWEAASCAALSGALVELDGEPINGQAVSLALCWAFGLGQRVGQGSTGPGLGCPSCGLRAGFGDPSGEAGAVRCVCCDHAWRHPHG